MVVSQSRIDRLRLEADTIFTRIETVEAALSAARESEGDHWETGELPLALATPTGEEIEVTLDPAESAAENAQRRYERAADLQRRLEQRRADAGELAVLPPSPVAVLVLSTLATEGPSTSRAVAAATDLDHDRVREYCEEMAAAGLLRTDESGRTYRLGHEGRSLWDHLDTREGKRQLLGLIDAMARLARRLWRGGPDYPTKTARDLGMDRGTVRTLYAAMRAVDVVEPYDGSIIKGSERKLSPKDETHKKHTYYVTTTVTDRILRETADS